MFHNNYGIYIGAIESTLILGAYGNKFTKGKTARIIKMMAMFVLFSSYVLYLSLLLSGSKVTLACENSLAKHWLN